MVVMVVMDGGVDGDDGVCIIVCVRCVRNYSAQ
jgi:hypothetical protein